MKADLKPNDICFVMETVPSRSTEAEANPLAHGLSQCDNNAMAQLCSALLAAACLHMKKKRPLRHLELHEHTSQQQRIANRNQSALTAHLVPTPFLCLWRRSPFAVIPCQCIPSLCCCPYDAEGTSRPDPSLDSSALRPHLRVVRDLRRVSSTCARYPITEVVGVPPTLNPSTTPTVFLLVRSRRTFPPPLFPLALAQAVIIGKSVLQLGPHSVSRGRWTYRPVLCLYHLVCMTVGRP